MNRGAAIQRLRSETFDVLVIGGGATGLGCALDAAARGYATALVEARDFANATSSRSTKLVHGGVRYLRQGNVALVREALAERSRLLHNAPDYVRPLEFFVPARGTLERAFYAAGLKIYDALAGSSDFPRSRAIFGGVLYWDAQFDDARLALAIARTASDRGAAIANYVRAAALRRENGRICGIAAHDDIGGENFDIRARSVINAAGIFVDAVRALDDAHAAPLLTFSRGAHIVVDAGALPDPGRALLVPRTPDGRVLFAIPWYGSALIGTTDVPAAAADAEPAPADSEVEYLLRTANPYLARSIDRGSIRSAFAGLRPLIDRKAAATARLPREHLVDVSASGLVTIAGGKWTTYRRMAQDAVDAAAIAAKLPPVRCSTHALPVHADDAPESFAERIEHAVRAEMAQTVQDVLARRTRMLFLDAQGALERAPATASLLARLLGQSEAWASRQNAEFATLADRYRVRAQANSAS